MEKHVGLNPAWFEPGLNGKSPFSELYRKSLYNTQSLDDSISAAFRALIAQDAAQEPPALQVGDVVRLERYENNPNGLSWFESEAHLIGTEEKISIIYEDGTVWLSVGTSWPVSALTLVCRAGEPAPADKDAEIAELRESLERSRLALNTTRQQRDKFWSQRDAARDDVHRLQSELHARNDEIVGLRAEVGRLTAELEKAKEWPAQALQMRYNRDMYLAVLKLICETYPETEDGELCDAWRRLLTERDAARAEVERLTAERDALRARIDEGRVMYGGMYGHEHDIELWTFTHVDTDTLHGRLIDARPIAEADERKAERRVVVPEYITEDGSDYAMAHHTPWITNKRKSDRRRTAGTIADRGQAS